jgi:NDP-sugar pyrophosphorylase family protein
MKAMILAAGEGTRLRPFTLERPKPMLPVAGRPMLEHTIFWLRHYGITQIAMNLHHRPQIVMEHFGDGSLFGISLEYSVEETILGTAGGAKRLAHRLDDTTVLVYGDVLTDLDLKALVDFHFSRPERPCLSMSLYRVPNPSECGVVILGRHDRIVRFQEKPEPTAAFSDLANAGILVMDPEVLAHIPDGCFYDFGRDLFPLLLRSAFPMYGWPLPADAYLVDIGTPDRYARVLREWPTPASRHFIEEGV